MTWFEKVRVVAQATLSSLVVPQQLLQQLAALWACHRSEIGL